MKMTKSQAKLLKDIKIGTSNENVTNPYSGESILLSPEAVALYDVIRGCECLMNWGHNLDKNATLMRAAIDVFRKNWPQEYMVLLD